MSYSGYVDWHRLDRTSPWSRNGSQHTSVFAFWTVDHGHNLRDMGVRLFKSEGTHPDWFLHADGAEHILAAYAHPSTLVSPNFTTVFEDNMAARPLLGGMLLGNTDAVYRAQDTMWWAHRDDLTRKGRSLLKRTDELYERKATLVTFVHGASDEDSSPRDPE